MRIAIDLQACQTDSRDRGIGRYAMSLVEAMSREVRPGDELLICVDMADAGRMRDVRHELRRRGVAVKVLAYGYPTGLMTDLSPSLRRAAGVLRSMFFGTLRPDALLIASLFETGTRYTTQLDWDLLDGIATATVAYDLIPLIYPDRYLPDGHHVSSWYRERLQDLPRFDSLLAISEATRQDIVKHLGIGADMIPVISAGFDASLAWSGTVEEGNALLREHGISAPFVLMIGNGDWRKNSIGALQAFADLPANIQKQHLLVMTQVGGDVSAALAGECRHLADRVRILGKVDDRTLALLYARCLVFFFPSLYEGFGLPVLEAMAAGSAVLSSSLGSLPEVVHEPAMLFDPRDRAASSAVLLHALKDASFRTSLKRGAREHASSFTWEKTAALALDAMRSIARPAGTGQPAWPLREHVGSFAEACMDADRDGEAMLERGLEAIAQAGKRRILVDLTEVIRLDVSTGIQRVTRNFFVGLSAVARETGEFSVEPFHWTEEGLRHARQYARETLGVASEGGDDAVRPAANDLIFMLDSSWWMPTRFDEIHDAVWSAGGEVVWMVHDLIPIRLPETCNPAMPAAFRTWLTHAVSTADGFVCNSEATRADLEAFMEEIMAPSQRKPWACAVHLGSDFDARPSEPCTSTVENVLARGDQSGLFVAVGTIEPRKDYETILDAFDTLWARGNEAILVIVGGHGWNVDRLVQRIEAHPNLDSRLFWFKGISDSDVHHLLRNATALIQASIAEGFGLPIVEAGRLGARLILADIPVFREIASGTANFFPVGDADGLVQEVESVARLRTTQDRTPTLPVRSWRIAAEDLASKLLGMFVPGEVAGR